MRDALGFNGRVRRKPWRNYHFTTEESSPEWNDLVSKDLATKGHKTEDGLYYQLTRRGVRIALGYPLTENEFDNLFYTPTETLESVLCRIMKRRRKQ